MELAPDLLIGIIGMALILIAFLLNQMSLWKNDDFLYDVTNFVGSVALAYYAWIGNVIPFIVLNVVWALFSLRDMFFDMYEMKKGKKKFYFYHLSSKR